MLTLNGFIVELMQKKVHVDLESGVVDHLAFFVEDLDSVMATFDNAKVKRFTPEPFDALGLKIMFYLGPDGEKIELMEVKHLIIDESLRLTKVDESRYSEALPWYADDVVLKGSENRSKPYSLDELHGMYKYLSSHGESYFIEVLENGEYRSIGDASLLTDSIPIVIGDSHYRGRGIGKKVLARLIERAYEVGRSSLKVKEIYDHNESSKKLYTSFGFEKHEKTKDGYSYQLNL